MALDDMFQGGIDAAVANRAQLAPPEPRQEPGFSFWGLVKAVPTGIASGGLESAGFWSEVVGAMGDVEASYNYSGMLPVGVATDTAWSPDLAEEARERLRTKEAFSNPVGDALRSAGRSLMPDEQTAGMAEQTLFQLSRVATKAVGYSLLTGPGAGSLLTGLDEGLSVSDELRQEDVDFGTRTQVGALAGVATGVGVRLPLAGTGWRSTAALVAAGGPGLFVAQNYLSREILENADYSTLADRYDPFDPVGLGVSTLLPAAFGAWGLRVRGRAARAAQPDPIGAPERAPVPESLDPEAVAAVRDLPHDADLVDAARVQRAREIVDSWNLGDAGDIRAANEALLSAMRAGEQLADGLPVQAVAEFPLAPARAAVAIERMIGRAEAIRPELLAEASRAADAGQVSALRTEIRALETARAQLLDDQSVRATADSIRQAEPRVAARQALARARREAEQRAADLDAQVSRLERQIEDNAAATQARQALAVLDAQLARMRADRAAIDAPATDLTPVAAAAREAAETAPARERQDAGRGQDGGTGDARRPEAAAPRETPAPDRVSQAAAAQGDAAPPPSAMAAVAARLDRLREAQPDTPVRLEGMPDEMPLAQVLEDLEAVAQREIRDADLLTVAANCFIGR